MSAQATIQQQIDSNAVVLYMKGCPDFPQCGFSATVAHILSEMCVPYFSVDVLEDPEIRDGIKQFSHCLLYTSPSPRD